MPVNSAIAAVSNAQVVVSPVHLAKHTTGWLVKVSVRWSVANTSIKSDFNANLAKILAKPAQVLILINAHTVTKASIWPIKATVYPTASLMSIGKRTIRNVFSVPTTVLPVAMATLACPVSLGFRCKLINAKSSVLSELIRSTTMFACLAIQTAKSVLLIRLVPNASR